MTAARQERKPAIFPRLFLGIALGAGILAPFSPSFSVSWAATDNQLAVNATTGLAISGFDPVAYFTEGKALFGRAEFELNLEGSVWRFNNEGNRGAFEKNPEVYAPQFGGYDPVAIGRGRVRSGASPDLGRRRATALSLLQRADARFFPRRSGPHLSTPRNANGPTSGT